jgi:hypothetical protein
LLGAVVLLSIFIALLAGFYQAIFFTQHSFCSAAASDTSQKAFVAALFL